MATERDGMSTSLSVSEGHKDHPRQLSIRSFIRDPREIYVQNARHYSLFGVALEADVVFTELVHRTRLLATGTTTLAFVAPGSYLDCLA
jgi:hypothetical protein